MNKNQTLDHISSVLHLVAGALISYGFLKTGGLMNDAALPGIILAAVNLLLSHSYNSTPPPTGGVGVKSLTLLGLMTVTCLVFTGCQNTQTMEHTSVQGFKGVVGVPIPFSGGLSFLTASMSVGSIKSTTAVQPVATNRLYSPSLAIADLSHGQDSASGSASTNATAGIAAGSWDKYLFAGGDTTASDNTNGVKLDGFNGFNPLQSTNKP